MQSLLHALVLLLVALCPRALAQSPSGVVVNEVFTGNPDWIEIANLSSTAVPIGGWQVQAVFGYTVYPVFTFPAGATISAGECIVVLENSGNLTSLANPHPATTQIFNTNFGYGWIGTSTGAVAIIDDQGQGHDLVFFGNGPCLTPPGAGALPFSGHFDRYANDPNLENVVHRKNNFDTDQGSDFEEAMNGTESPGQTNPGQSLGPPALARIALDPATGAVGYDPNTQTFSFSAGISGLGLANGQVVSDPAWDSLIGGSISFNGTAVGNVAANHDALLLLPSQIDFAGATGNHLIMNGVVAAEVELEQTLAGPHGTRPYTQRAISTRTLSSMTTTGTPSQAMLALQIATQANRIYFVIRFEENGPRLVGIDVGRDLNAPAPGMESRLAHVGLGGLEIGVIRCSMNAVIFNVFVVNPSLPLGQGPVEGISWGAAQWQQVYMPLPSFPFHVNPTLPGTYHFALPEGSMPQGVWLDHVAIQLLNGIPVFSEPTRAFF